MLPKLVSSLVYKDFLCAMCLLSFFSLTFNIVFSFLYCFVCKSFDLLQMVHLDNIDKKV